MTLTEFNQLSPEDQGIVAMSGSFVTDRRAGSQTVALYRLDDLYMEVWYDAEHNRITQLNAFDSLSGLVPYIHL